uniref:RING-type E3 ubiquitin transferase n=1 Tax=Heterorhabditis bacteriophora TaxID=37862 RepID=A0A1I7W8T4_HETBA
MSGNRRRRARNLLDNAEEQVRRFAGVLNNVLNRERQDLVSHPDREFSVSSESEEESDSIGSSSDNSEEYSEVFVAKYSILKDQQIELVTLIPDIKVEDYGLKIFAVALVNYEFVILTLLHQLLNKVTGVYLTKVLHEEVKKTKMLVSLELKCRKKFLTLFLMEKLVFSSKMFNDIRFLVSSSTNCIHISISRLKITGLYRVIPIPVSNLTSSSSSKPDPIKVSEPQNNKAVTVIEDDADDDGCTICYEDFANAGVHRLVSLKCGHFFGQSCIERWIRGEGRSAGCPTCKAKASNKDIRKHYARSIKVLEYSAYDFIRISIFHLYCNFFIFIFITLRVPVVPLPLPYSRPGRMSLTPGKKMALSISNNGSSRAFDWNGEYFAVGVSSPGSMFQPYAVRKVGWVSSEFRAGPCLPLHSNRIRVVSFSPFESNLVLSGGEDKKAVVHILGGSVRKQWKMPNDRQVWAGCWTAPNKVALGLNDGRVLEFDIELESTEPVRDFTQGIGNMPILFIGFDPTSSVLVVASFKKVLAFHNDRVFPLLNSLDDQFDKIRSIAFDEGTLSFVATFSPGTNSPGISHRLYKIEINQDSDEVRDQLGNNLKKIVFRRKRKNYLMVLKCFISNDGIFIFIIVFFTKSTAQSKRLRFRLGDHSYVVDEKYKCTIIWYLYIYIYITQPSSQDPCSICAMFIFSTVSVPSISDVDSTARPVSLLRRNESAKEKQFDTSAAIETIEK